MIPKLHYTSKANSTAAHLENIQKACGSGAELVQLDLEHIAVKEHLKLAQEIIKITAHFQTRLIIKSHYKIAHEIKADGIYLENTDTCPSVARAHLYPWQTIGATAHTLQDCETLLTKEVDYIGLGPFRTSQNTKTKALGIHGYTAINEGLETETPLIGFGDITPEDVKGILKTGISGIAVTNAITQNFDLIKTFNQLLGASSTDEMRHSFK
jgi:thiamine-phosphate pyrophosphorylase